MTFIQTINYSTTRRVIVSFLSGFVISDPGDGSIGTWGGQETSGGRTGGHKVAVWLLKCDYYEIQVKCCIDCLIVCLAHFDNSHNEQQSQHKIQVLTTNQSDSCSHKKQPKKTVIFSIFIYKKLLEDKEYPLVSEGQGRLGRWPGEGWGRQNMTTLWGVSMSKYQLSRQENYFKLYSHMFTSVDTK